MGRHAIHKAQQTSTQAFLTHEANGKRITKKAQIVDYMRGRGCWISRREISSALGFDTATVSGLVRPMIADETIIELENKNLIFKCPITGEYVNFIILAETVEKRKKWSQAIQNDFFNIDQITLEGVNYGR